MCADLASHEWLICKPKGQVWADPSEISIAGQRAPFVDHWKIIDLYDKCQGDLLDESPTEVYTGERRLPPLNYNDELKVSMWEKSIGA